MKPRERARRDVELHGPHGPVGADREPPLCGHTDTWSWDHTTPLVCQLCHPKPGTAPPRPPAPPPRPTVTSRLHPSPWRHEYR